MGLKLPSKLRKLFLVECIILNICHDIIITIGLFEMLVRSGPPPRLEAFLKIRPESLDATSRAVYRAQAMALLRALLALPGGPGHLADYLAGLPGVNPADAGKLLQKFPALAAQPGNGYFFSVR